jgi:hypothetical protein
VNGFDGNSYNIKIYSLTLFFMAIGAPGLEKPLAINHKVHEIEEPLFRAHT